MDIFLLFTFALFLMVLGHIFKTKRWALFISIYEKPNKANLLNALSIGHILNAILPIRIGDIFRVFHAGRKLKNGYVFSLATVIADLYVEVITVGIIFSVLLFSIKQNEKLAPIAMIYICSSIALIVLTIIANIFRKRVKLLIAKIASIFNTHIQFNILYASYLSFASINDIARKIDKLKFLFYTFMIWLGYLTSYYTFSIILKKNSFDYNFEDVFVDFFGIINLYSINKEAFSLWGGYLIFPLLITLLISLVIKKDDDGKELYKSALPQLNESDKLAFLKTYYAEEDREAVKAYLKINDDITIVKDCSAGSNASTLLVMKNDGQLFFRKYAFNEDGKKLKEQIHWIKSHYGLIPLPFITNLKESINFVSYDMVASKSFVGFFKFIHTSPIKLSIDILNTALNDLRESVHNKNLRDADISLVNEYIEKKVNNNLKIILNNNKYIKQLESYDDIVINGKNFKPLKFYKPLYDQKNLKQIFINDKYSDIHGDLTIENIICGANFEEASTVYYIIDPNTGNIHNSPFLDYSKLLQSLHGKYEFLMMVNDVSINKNIVNFILTESEMYSKLYEYYKEYLLTNFTSAQVKSIYYHEFVHFLRLMPYKIHKNERLAVVFYTGLIKVLNDIYEMEILNENKASNF
ncbi:MAG: lysylphosphatidylglycerol synthase transmembrane domain-containing protein [Bdellovibrionota bacterium]